MTFDDPNIDLEHEHLGGDCLTCGVKWPCPTAAACPRCDTDRHICPGCGANLWHGLEACSDCVALARRERFRVIQ